MAAERPHVILLSGEPERTYEALAGAAITPGMLIAKNATGAVIPHAGGTAAAAPLFAREMDLAGGTIDDAYETGDTVVYHHAQRGDRIYAFLADEGTSAIGGLLESAGGGALRPVTTGVPVATALELVNNVGGTGPVRLKVEVL